MAKNNRLKNTRVVTFKEDYKVGKKVLYKKGETHYIHVDTVEKKELKKVATVAEFDEEAEIKKARKALGIKR